jgi:hypothetical protein
LTLRDSGAGFPIRTASDGHALLRFAIDAANNTIDGIAFGDISSVTLNVFVTSGGNAGDKITVFGLVDNADPDGTSPSDDADSGNTTDDFLSETSWAAGTVSSLNSPIGLYSAGNMARLETASAFVYNDQLGLLDEDNLSGAKSISLDVTFFKSFLTNSSNNEVSLILTGPVNRNIDIASFGNTGGNAVPSLTITAIPEPATLGLVGAAGLALLLWRRNKRSH